jgi:hypothetical protein
MRVESAAATRGVTRAFVGVEVPTTAKLSA